MQPGYSTERAAAVVVAAVIVTVERASESRPAQPADHYRCPSVPEGVWH